MARILTLIVVVAAILAAPASAADLSRGRLHHRAHHAHRAKIVTPDQWAGAYPVAWRARKILRADSCWRGCQADAGRAFQSCLQVNDSSGCVQRSDAADRCCQRECRLYGGPLVNLPQ